MYRTLLIGLALGLGLAAVPGRAADPNAEKPLGTWNALRVWPRHAQLRGELMQAIRAGDIPAMESTCRAALEVLPGDATWHYNLACALAYRAQPGLALTEPEKAILFGFRDAEAIAKDRDFAVSGNRPAYAQRVAGQGPVAKVAEAPAFDGSEAGFRCTADAADPTRTCLSATVANAVAGFTYGWTAADALTDAFTPAGTPVEATEDGPLALELKETEKAARFYRITASR